MPNFIGTASSVCVGVEDICVIVGKTDVGQGVVPPTDGTGVTDGAIMEDVFAGSFISTPDGLSVLVVFDSPATSISKVVFGSSRSSTADVVLNSSIARVAFGSPLSSTVEVTFNFSVT